MKFVGIFRESHTSGNPQADRLCLQEVQKSLEQKGISVEMIDGENVSAIEKTEGDLFFSMGREKKLLDILQKKTKKQVRVVNSSDAIRLCFNREKIYSLMQKNQLPLPKTTLADITKIRFEQPVLLKKSDTHGKPGDTFIVKTKTEFDGAISSLKKAGKKKVLVQEFVNGTTYKFYGIGETIFLPNFDQPELQNQIKADCAKLAKLIGLDVYGGDFLLDPATKRFFIVDFNDWPSFSSIRETAGQKIAELLLTKKGIL